MSLETYAALLGESAGALYVRPLVAVEIDCGRWGRVELPRRPSPDTATDIEELAP